MPACYTDRTTLTLTAKVQSHLGPELTESANYPVVKFLPIFFFLGKISTRQINAATFNIRLLHTRRRVYLLSALKEF